MLSDIRADSVALLLSIDFSCSEWKSMRSKVEIEVVLVLSNHSNLTYIVPYMVAGSRLVNIAVSKYCLDCIHVQDVEFFVVG